MTAVDIVAMPVAEKLKLMEALWDSLCAPTTDGSFKSPEWHEQALKQADDALAVGSAHLLDWNDAKEQLRRCGQA